MTTNRDYALALLGRRPKRERALALLAASGPVVLSVEVREEVTPELARAIVRKLQATPNARRLDIFIDSDGGDVAAGFAIFDAIRGHSATEKATHGVGAVHSVAALIFAAGDTRHLYDGATVLLHRAEIDPHADGRWTAREYTKLAEHLGKIDGGIAATIAERCGCSVETIEREMRTEAQTQPRRARALGLATSLH